MKKRFRNAKTLVFRELQRLGQDSRFGSAHRQQKLARAGHTFDPGGTAEAIAQQDCRHSLDAVHAGEQGEGEREKGEKENLASSVGQAPLVQG